MAYVMLFGMGWTQRWQVADGAIELVSAEITHVGRDETGQIPILDPATDEPTVLAVAWKHVAAAVVMGSEGQIAMDDEGSSGLYR